MYDLIKLSLCHPHEFTCDYIWCKQMIYVDKEERGDKNISLGYTEIVIYIVTKEISQFYTLFSFI